MLTKQAMNRALLHADTNGVAAFFIRDHHAARKGSDRTFDAADVFVGDVKADARVGEQCLDVTHQDRIVVWTITSMTTPEGSRE
jgi:hypothetical protein